MWIIDEINTRLRKMKILTPVKLFEHVHPTPIVKLEKAQINGSPLYAKLEYFNPFSQSIKDRPVMRLIEEAIRRKASVIYEASSGNFALALTLISNAYGIRTKIFLPKTTSQTTINILKAIGAEVVVTDFDSISPAMIKMVKELAEKDGAINLNQFENDLNPQVHFETTAREAYETLSSNNIIPDYIILGIGTTGTMMGVSKFFRERNVRFKLIAVQPSKGNSIPGIKRVETNPKWLESSKPDMIVDVSTKEAVDGAIEVARKEGLPIGLSAGAFYIAYKKIASRFTGVYFTIFPDSIYKYSEILSRYI